MHPPRWRPPTTLTLLGVALVSVALADGCGPAPAAPANPSWLPTPLSAAPVAPAPEPVHAVPATVADPARAIFDPHAIVTVLDDPRLAHVKALVAREKPVAAGDALRDWLASTKLEPAEEAVFQYQLGRLRVQASDGRAAVRAFDRAAALDWPLREHARLRAAEVLVQIAEHTSAGLGGAGSPEAADARSRLQAMLAAGTSPNSGEVTLLLARAAATARDLDGAAAIWRAYLGQKPLPSGWHDVALHFARSLLAHPTVDRAEEAARVSRLVIYESPGGRGLNAARELEQRALESLPLDRRQQLTGPHGVDLMRRARGLADAHKGRDAVAAAEQLIEQVLTVDRREDTRPSELACEAYIAKGKGLATLKRYAESSQELGTAIERCQGHPRRAHALLLGGSSAVRGGQLAEARRRYATLEREFPTHSFADDARLHGAEAANKLGDAKAFTSMLLTIADDYPDGDMVDQALFTLARARIDAGDWAGAIVPLEKAVARQKRGRPYYAEGRPQYFLARAKQEVGLTEEGDARMAEVIGDFPLSYYMLLAYRRLAARDPARAAEVTRQAVAAEPDGTFVIDDHPELHRPGFLRAVELVRQGEAALALAELDHLGVREDNAHPSLVWAGAILLSRIDAPAESHGLLRSSPTVWREHFPAGVWRPLWEVAYPRPYATIVEIEAAKNGIPRELAFAIMREESAFNPSAVSHAGAYGLMQLIEPTARHMAKPLGLPASPVALKRPEVNVALGCRFLAILLRKFPFNPALAIPGYNAGPGAPDRWLKERPADDFDLWVERMPYKETRHYTKRVLQTLTAYAMLYGPGMDHPLLQIPIAVKP